MKIVSVLRTGPEYQGEHAQLLHAQLPPEAVCLTNLPDIPGVNTLPLRDSDLMGWWAKMELFNPEGPLGDDDLFYLDIDTLVLEDVRPLMNRARSSRNLVMLSDFFVPEHAASGVMFIPRRIKARVWDAWCANPYWHMVKHRPSGRIGDQGFISDHVQRIQRWDDLCPGKIISYKKHIAAPGQPGYTRAHSVGDGTIPAGAAIVAFHGSPRPWELEQPLCKPSSSDIAAEPSGSPSCSAQSPVQPPPSTTPTKARSRGTTKHSKSRPR